MFLQRALAFYLIWCLIIWGKVAALLRLKVKALVPQLCPTLCNPVDCSLSDSSVHGIFQARILNGLPFPFSRGSSQPSIKPRSSALQADSLTAELQGKPREYYIEVKRYCSIFIRHSVLLLESPVIYLNIINCVLICFTLGIFSFSAPLKKYLNLRFT